MQWGRDTQELAAGRLAPKPPLVHCVEMIDTDALPMYVIHIGKNHPGWKKDCSQPAWNVPHPPGFKSAEAYV